MALAVAVIVLFQPATKISFFDLRVVNDTHRSVTIQPCWDVYCLDTHGLSASVIAPGRSVHEAGDFPTDRGGEIVVAIRKPGGKPWEFSSCLFTSFAPHQDTGVARISHARKCFSKTGD